VKTNADGKEVDSKGKEKVITTETKKDIDIKTGTKTETTHTVKDKKVESVNGSTAEANKTVDGSKKEAEGQTKDIGLPSPKK
jgi:hypothetical protein